MKLLIKKLVKFTEDFCPQSMLILKHGLQLCCGILCISIILELMGGRNTYLYYKTILLSKGLAECALIVLLEIVIGAFVIDIYIKDKGAN